MDLLNKLLDEDEKILWKRETKENLIPDLTKFKQNKKRKIMIFIIISTIIISIIIF